MSFIITKVNSRAWWCCSLLYSFQVLYLLIMHDFWRYFLTLSDTKCLKNFSHFWQMPLDNSPLPDTPRLSHIFASSKNNECVSQNLAKFSLIIIFSTSCFADTWTSSPSSLHSTLLIDLIFDFLKVLLHCLNFLFSFSLFHCLSLPVSSRCFFLMLLLKLLTANILPCCVPLPFWSSICYWGQRCLCPTCLLVLLTPLFWIYPLCYFQDYSLRMPLLCCVTYF